MVRMVRRCVRHPSTDSAVGHGSSGTKLPRKTEDGDSLQMLSNVQRQLVQKSFQTYEFEAKIKAKDRDEEHATTANEVLQQALRTHAASVAALHVDGVPSSDDYRQRMPKRSLGRFQYEDMSRIPAGMAEHPTADGSLPSDTTKKPLLLLRPAEGHQPQEPRVEGDDAAIGRGNSPNNIASMDDGVTGDDTVGSSDAATSLPESSLRGVRRTGYSPGHVPTGQHASQSTGTGISAGGISISCSKLTHKSLPVKALRNGGSAGSSAQAFAIRGGRPLAPNGGGGGGSAGVHGADGPSAGYAGLHCAGRGMRRADQMLQALRGSHGSAPGYSMAALPLIPRPPLPLTATSSPYFSSAAVKSGHGALRSSITRPSNRNRQTSCNLGASVRNTGSHAVPAGGGGCGGGGGGEALANGDASGGSLIRQVMLAMVPGSSYPDHQPGNKNPGPRCSGAGPAAGRQQQQQQQLHWRGRSPQHLQLSSQLETLSQGGITALRNVVEQPARSDREGEFPAGLTPGLSATSTTSTTTTTTTSSTWRSSPPSQPPSPAANLEPSGIGIGSGGALGSAIRRSFTCGNGAVAPLQVGPRSLRQMSITDEGGGSSNGDGEGSGSGPHAAAATASGVSGGRESGSIVVLNPAATGTEQLFTRISRSAARAGTQQQWTPTFDTPLPSCPASGTFTAASCGASPYAAPGLSACVETAYRDSGNGGRGHTSSSGNSSSSGRRATPALQWPASGAPGQAALKKASSGVRFPPISDASAASVGGPGDAGGESDTVRERNCRRARVRPSLSCSAAEGATIAAFVQQTRPTPPPQPLAASVSWQSWRYCATQYTTPQATAAAAREQLSHGLGGAGNAKGSLAPQRSGFGTDVDRPANLLSTAGWPTALALLLDPTNVSPNGLMAAATGAMGDGDGSGSGGGGGGSVFPSPRERRPVLRESGDGGGVSGGGEGGAAPGPGDSPSIMKRMRLALGSFLGRSPGDR